MRSDIPSEKTVYVETYGCAANKFDLEIMFSYLSEAGYKLIDDPFRATLILMNTCGVKKPTEDRIIGKLRSISLLNKPLIITGCLPRINLKAIISAAPNFSVIIDPWSIDKMPLAIKSVENREKHKFFFSQKPIQKLKLPKMRFNPLIEIVLISEGCLGACAFCCVKLARTGFASFSKKSIVDRVKQAVSEGAREIWLTSQDNGAYGLDINTNLAELLKKCCQIEGQFMIRVGMMNPNHVLRMLPELVETYKNKKVFKFLHLPVQSG
ncbi:MAG: radical SAM protein, partial [Candidatus Bathyarchaeia archaeon]